MKKKSLHFSLRYTAIAVFSIFFASLSAYGLSTITEGWKVKKNETVKVDLVVNYGSGNCKNISSSSYDVFVPTKTLSDWNAFTTNAPGNGIGVSMTNCSGSSSGVINGVCSSSPAVCTSGTVSGDNGNTTPGGTRTWNCLGSGGGTNQNNCSYTNPPASCVPNGSYTYGSCDQACGNNGVREKYDSCNTLIDANDPCNRFSCPSSCTPTGWTQTSAPTCSSEGEQSRTLSDCSTETQSIPQLSGSSCPTGSWTAGTCNPKPNQTCGTGNGTRSYSCAGGNGYCAGSQPANEDCDLAACPTISCSWTPIGGVCGNLEAEPLADFPICDSGNIGAVEIQTWIPGGGTCGGGKQSLQKVQCQCH